MEAPKFELETTMIVDWSGKFPELGKKLTVQYNTSVVPFNVFRSGKWTDTQIKTIDEIEKLGGDVVWAKELVNCVKTPTQKLVKVVDMKTEIDVHDLKRTILKYLDKYSTEVLYDKVNKSFENLSLQQKSRSIDYVAYQLKTDKSFDIDKVKKYVADLIILKNQESKLISGDNVANYIVKYSMLSQIDWEIVQQFSNIKVNSEFLVELEKLIKAEVKKFVSDELSGVDYIQFESLYWQSSQDTISKLLKKLNDKLSPVLGTINIGKLSKLDDLDQTKRFVEAVMDNVAFDCNGQLKRNRIQQYGSIEDTKTGFIINRFDSTVSKFIKGASIQESYATVLIRDLRKLLIKEAKVSRRTLKHVAYIHNRHKDVFVAVEYNNHKISLTRGTLDNELYLSIVPIYKVFDERYRSDLVAFISTLGFAESVILVNGHDTEISVAIKLKGFGEKVVVEETKQEDITTQQYPQAYDVNLAISKLESELRENRAKVEAHENEINRIELIIQDNIDKIEALKEAKEIMDSVLID